MATIPGEDYEFDLSEQLARINKMRAETEKSFFEMRKLLDESAKVRVDTRLAPLTTAFAGLGAGAALFAAGAAFAKLFIG